MKHSLFLYYSFLNYSIIYWCYNSTPAFAHSYNNNNNRSYILDGCCEAKWHTNCLEQYSVNQRLLHPRDKRIEYLEVTGHTEP